jgi:hypothetical protein
MSEKQLTKKRKGEEDYSEIKVLRLKDIIRKGRDFILRILENAKDLEILDFSESNFKNQNQQSIFQSLRPIIIKNTNIIELNISNCKMSKTEIEYIIDIVKENKSIKKIDLSSIDIIYKPNEKPTKDEGGWSKSIRKTVHDLFVVIGQSNVLKEISFHNCGFTDQFDNDMHHITNGKSLRKLDISSNTFYNRSIFLDGLSYNHTILELNVNHTFDNITNILIEKLLERNKNIEIGMLLLVASKYYRKCNCEDNRKCDCHSILLEFGINVTRKIVKDLMDDIFHRNHKKKFVYNKNSYCGECLIKFAMSHKPKYIVDIKFSKLCSSPYSSNKYEPYGYTDLQIDNVQKRIIFKDGTKLFPKENNEKHWTKISQLEYGCNGDKIIMFTKRYNNEIPVIITGKHKLAGCIESGTDFIFKHVEDWYLSAFIITERPFLKIK